MTPPLKIDAGLREVALPSTRPVGVRVLRMAVAVSLPWLGGVWAYALPVAVVDRGSSPARVRPIIGFGQAITGAFALVILLDILAAGRRRARNGAALREESNGGASDG